MNDQTPKRAAGERDPAVSGAARTGDASESRRAYRYRWKPASQPRTPGEIAPDVEARTPHRRWRPFIGIAVPVLIVAALLVALRDPKPEAPPGEDRLLRYCATLIERHSLPLPDPVESPSEEVKHSVPVTAGRLVLLTEKMIENAPQESKAELRRQLRAYRELVRTRDPVGFRSAELQESRNKLSAADAETCNMRRVAFRATSFSYEEFPTRLEGGRYSLQMSNVSEQAHQLVLFRRKPEFAGDFSRLLTRGKVDEEATRVASGFAHAGKRESLYVELAGGDYAIACFMRAGSEPHWQKGMIAEFSVR